MAYGYDRLGRNTSVVQSYTGSSIQTLFDLCVCGKVSDERFDATFFGGRVLTHFMNANADGFKGRTTGYALKLDTTTEQMATYGYESSTGRLNTLATQATGSSAYTHTFTYGYRANSDMIESLSVDTGHPFTITRDFESTRDVLTSIETKWSTTRRVKYAYTYDNRRQRASWEQSGDVFADYGGSGGDLGAMHQLFAYNGRGELVDAASYVGPLSGGQSSANFMSARRHEFAYDGIGNRRTSNTSGVSGTQDNYVVNELNQYVAKENNTLAVGGTVANDSAIKVVAGANAQTLAGRHGRHWGDNMLLDNLNGPYLGPVKLFAAKVGGGSGGTDLLKTLDRTAFLPPAWQQMSYDEDGNILDDGVWTYTWDGENRLIAMQTKTAAIGAGIASADARRLEFKYDHLGRRIEKLVRSGWNGSSYATVASHRRFLYNGWNVIAEYTVSSGTLALGRTYTWGLDIVHELTKSGGVGALVQIADHALGKGYFPAYDGNGNIAALFDGAPSGGTAGECVAKYEYSPYGEFLRCEGTYAKENPFRFSTKFTDDETGLVYYGLRYYSPSQGRFLGRDPKGEAGGTNLYAFVRNNPKNAWDYLGMTMMASVSSHTRRETYVDEDGCEWEVMYSDISDVSYGISEWVEDGRTKIRCPQALIDSDPDEGCGGGRAGLGRQALSVGVGFLPFVGSAQSLVELVSGKDYITGEKANRWLAGLGLVAGLIPFGKGALNGGAKLFSAGARNADEAVDIAKVAVREGEGVIYKRINPNTGAGYVGQSANDATYAARQGAHNRAGRVRYDFEDIGHARPGTDLDLLEEAFIRSEGGLIREGGTLQNKRHQMAADRFVSEANSLLRRKQTEIAAQSGAANGVAGSANPCP